jgi:hypothetical protein
MLSPQMNSVVADELAGFPWARRSSQNLFRAVYQCSRMNSLGRHPRVFTTAAAYGAAVKTIIGIDPDFEPTALV